MSHRYKVTDYKKALKELEPKKEFNLSKNRIRFGHLVDIEKQHKLEGCHANKMIYQEEDIKEFIKLLKDDFMSCNDMPNTTEQEVRVMDYVLKKIDKLAGDKLR